MQIDEEIPESLEELEKEIEELEKAEIAPPPEVAKRGRIRPEVPTERRFRVSSIFLGFLILFIYLFALSYISISNLLSELEISSVSSGEKFMIAALLPLTVSPSLPNIMLLIITGELELAVLSVESYETIITFLSLVLIYSYSLSFSSDVYVLLFFVGILPYLLAGIVAGLLNRDPGYGFVAGLIIWVLLLAISSTIMYFFMLGITDTTVSFSDIIVSYIGSGYLSAIFLCIFGALGGASGKG